MKEEALQNKKYNGKIELLRFIFSIYVLLFHGCKYFLGEPSLKNNFKLSFFAHGSIGVEFFFLVSGFLMAKNAYKLVKNVGCNSEKIGGYTTDFMKRKFVGIFPEHFVAYIFAIVSYVLLKSFTFKKIPLYIVRTLPNLFLVQMIGFNGNSPNHVEWYISVMLISMFILYPIILKKYDLFVNAIAPATALLLLGYMSHEYGSLSGVQVWTGICYKSILRGIAEISLGAVSFEICRKMENVSFSTGKKLLLSVIEIGCFVITSMFVVSTFSKQAEVYILFLIMILVTLSFSRKTFYPNWLDSEFVAKLGRITLPIYLCQVPAINLVNWKLVNMDVKGQIVAYLIITIALSLLCMILSSPLKNLFVKIKKTKAEDR